MATNELLDTEKDLRKNYKRIIPGTIKRETEGTHSGKLSVKITCSKRGCKEVRRVATSDLFQVKKCVACTLEARAARRRERRKLATA